MAAEARRCAISSTTCSFRSLTIRPWRRSKTRRFSLAELSRLGDRLALITDSYVVDPLIFRGGDIGKLAVCGTINDLAVGGAASLYLTCSAIIEEGLKVDTLRVLAKSMASAAADAGVLIVTGDTKVVHRGTCDKLFLNTAGVGIIREGVNLGADRCRPGDSVLVNGLLGDHGTLDSDRERLRRVARAHC
jgi:hydrogenase expression/formation protein HypE